MKPLYEVGTILRNHKSFIEQSNFNTWQKRVLYTLGRCRTSLMGGHIDRCSDSKCERLHLSYNSCRNRHCPKCQGHLRELWMQKREEELLPIGYYHVVFTLPSELNELVLHQPRLIYNTLFNSAWKTIEGFGNNPDYLGAKTAMIAILHTWGSNLSVHPHLHCIVPSGGVTKKGKWKQAIKGEDFLFPVKELSKVFRAKFVQSLRKEGIKDKKLFAVLFTKDWVVYAKKPFGNPSTVVEYLGRYTHKIAISNHRIIAVDQSKVTFNIKDYKNEGKKSSLTLNVKEFIRRFSLHILPKGFVRIRHYGFLSSTGKRRYLSALQKELGKPIIKNKKRLIQHLLCPTCKIGNLRTVCVFKGRAPPRHWLERLEKQKKEFKKINAKA